MFEFEHLLSKSLPRRQCLNEAHKPVKVVATHPVRVFFALKAKFLRVHQNMLRRLQNVFITIGRCSTSSYSLKPSRRTVFMCLTIVVLPNSPILDSQVNVEYCWPGGERISCFQVTPFGKRIIRKPCVVGPECCKISHSKVVYPMRSRTTSKSMLGDHRQ